MRAEEYEGNESSLNAQNHAIKETRNKPNHHRQDGHLVHYLVINGAGETQPPRVEHV